MALALELLLFAVGLTVALVASSRAVNEARELALGLGAPPFVVGFVLVAVGTDLPEIANSITAHLQGEGDINVGDSIGSVLTQYTLVLGLIPLLAGAFLVNRREVTTVGLLTIPGLVLSILPVRDDYLGRLDGLLLVGTWLILVAVAIRVLPTNVDHDAPPPPARPHLIRIAVVLVLLALVGVGASLAVRSLVRIADVAGVSEFLIAYFGAALATSAPELVVVATAAFRGAYGLALGDALGASFVDSSLSIGIGPLVVGAPVTSEAAIPGIAYALAATVLATLLLMTRGRHDRRSSALLLALYALAYVLVLGADL